MKFTKDNNFKPPKSKKQWGSKLAPKSRRWENRRHNITWLTASRNYISLSSMATRHIIAAYNRLNNQFATRIWANRLTSDWQTLFMKELRYRNFILQDKEAETWWETNITFRR